MAFFNGWPWTQFQEQNLDWLIRQVKKLSETASDYEEFKKMVTDWMADLDVPAVVADQIQELIDNGTIEDMIQNIGIAALFDGAFLIPEQFKTDLNTWDDAFEDMIAAAASGNKIVIPDHTYDLTSVHFLPESTVNNAGVYPDQVAISPVEYHFREMGHPKAQKVDTSYPIIQGACIHNGLLAFVKAVNSGDAYLVIQDLATGNPVSSFRLNTYANVHGGSVTWDPDHNKYVISTGVTDSLCECTAGGVVTMQTVNIGARVAVITKVPGGYVLGDTTQKIVYTDDNYNIIKTISLTDLPANVNGGAYTSIQDFEYHDGYMYYLYSCFDVNDTVSSGFYIVRGDLSDDPKYEIVYSRLYDDMILTGFEAEHLIMMDDRFYVGAYNSAYYVLMEYNDDADMLSINNRTNTVYADETLTYYGSGTAASKFNCLFTALYYANKSGLILDLENCTFPNLHYYNLKLKMKPVNVGFSGDWYSCEIYMYDGSLHTVNNDLVYFRDQSHVMILNMTWEVSAGYSRNILFQTSGAPYIWLSGVTATLNNASDHIAFLVRARIITINLSSNTNNYLYLYGDCLLIKIDNQAYTVSQSGTNKIL